jgi:UDP-N-acetylglucosamine:LPS N-acetylglucosamine transferase
MLQLKNIYKKYDHFFFTFKRSMSKELEKKEKIHFVIDPRRNPLSLGANFLQSFLVFFKEKPDVIIANGGGVVLPLCYISKLFNKKIIFIESFSRVFEPSLTGRLINPLADLFIVQWERLLRFYKNAKYGGSIF